MKIRDILAVLSFVLTIYSFTGGTLLGIVNYPRWRSFNPTDFPAIHQAVNKQITIFYVPFFFLGCAGQYLAGLVPPGCHVHTLGGGYCGCVTS